MEPPVAGSAKIWPHVPGYESDSDEAEPEAVGERDTARFDAILATLSDRWQDAALVPFAPVKLPKGKDAKEGSGRSTAEKLRRRTSTFRSASGKVPATFRLEHASAPIVRETCASNGMVQVDTQDFCLLWSGPGLKESAYRDMHEYQRINHFPRSTELTRKDNMYAHLTTMAQEFSYEVYDFIPLTFVMPEQAHEFMEAYRRLGGLWIVKPNNAACGRGIFIFRDLSTTGLSLSESAVICRYVENPLLIQGLKFDLRVYVVVTQYEPLRAYIYREGLARFASAPYSTDDASLSDKYRQLTNYSINKSAPNFLENSELELDNYGHKWSLSALNKHLKCVGVDAGLMWTRIMDLVVKTLFAVEPTIGARTRKAVAHSGVCFEVYGFDVLIDDHLKPWILEVNLSPSMRADSPLDWQVKSSLLSDAFNLVGVCNPDYRMVRASQARAQILQLRMAHRKLLQERGSFTGLSADGRRRGPGGAEDSPKSEASSSGGSPATAKSLRASAGSGRKAPTVPIPDTPLLLDGLSEGQLKMLVRSFQEFGRANNFIRLHPTRLSVERYAPIVSARAKGWRSPSQILAWALFGPTPVPSEAGRRALEQREQQQQREREQREQRRDELRQQREQQQKAQQRDAKIRLPLPLSSRHEPEDGDEEEKPTAQDEEEAKEGQLQDERTEQVAMEAGAGSPQQPEPTLPLVAMESPDAPGAVHAPVDHEEDKVPTDWATLPQPKGSPSPARPMEAPVPLPFGNPPHDAALRQRSLSPMRRRATSPERPAGATTDRARRREDAPVLPEVLRPRSQPLPAQPPGGSDDDAEAEEQRDAEVSSHDDDAQPFLLLPAAAVSRECSPAATSPTPSMRREPRHGREAPQAAESSSGEELGDGSGTEASLDSVPSAASSGAKCAELGADRPRALRALQALDATDRWRLLLMEYLLRLGRACASLGTGERTQLAQSSAYARLSSFSRRLRELHEAWVARAPEAAAAGADDDGSDLDSGELVHEIGGACRLLLRSLAAGRWAADAGHSSRPSSRASGAGRRRALARLLPAELLGVGRARQAVDLLPALTSVDLEALLASPSCAADFDPLPGLFDISDPGAGAQGPYSPFRELAEAGSRLPRTASSTPALPSVPARTASAGRLAARQRRPGSAQRSWQRPAGSPPKAGPERRAAATLSTGASLALPEVPRGARMVRCASSSLGATGRRKTMPVRGQSWSLA